MRLIIVTCPKKDSERIIDEILESKLVACILNIKLDGSKFWWEGKICKEEESLLVFKTRKELVDKLFEKLKEIHPYDVPFIAEIKVEKVNKDYFQWLKEVTQ